MGSRPHRKATALVALAVLFALSVCVSVADAAEGPDYRAMVDQIEALLERAIAHYRAGEAEQARKSAQDAYFEVFENLEGPIRTNISARKSAMMEMEFVQIRMGIKNGEPVEKVQERMDDLMVELRAVLPEIESGFVLVAEASDGQQPAPEEPPARSADGPPVDPVWKEARNAMAGWLEDGLRAYRDGDVERAKGLVQRAQYDAFKNSMLETAVSRYVSYRVKSDVNRAFARTIAQMKGGAPAKDVEATKRSLMGRLDEALPGLPVPEELLRREEADGEQPDAGKEWEDVTARIFTRIGEALDAYAAGERENAVMAVQDTYFDVFEASGMEAQVGARSQELKTTLEGHFTGIVARMKAGEPAGRLRGAVDAMKADFDRAAGELSPQALTPWVLFLSSLLIIVREGVEAILIVMAIIAYLIKTGHREKVTVIYSGCFWAVVVSVVLAVLLKGVFHVSGAGQELLEGVTMLLAMAVLFFVSYWLLSKAQAHRWEAYIEGQVEESLSSGSLWGLWFAAFLAVVREGAETVLFYQALLGAEPGRKLPAVGGGFVLGCLLLVGFYLALRYGTLRLPLRPFFAVTGSLLFLMAFIFAGKGMMELMEAGVFSPSRISWMPEVPVLGIHPYVQTIMPQALLAVAAGAALAVLARRKPSAAESPGGEGGDAGQ